MTGDVRRALALLDEIAAAGEDGLHRLALIDMVPRGSLSRLLRALDDAGALERVCRGRWRAAPRLEDAELRPRLAALLRERPQGPRKPAPVSSPPARPRPAPEPPGGPEQRCETCRWYRRRKCQLRVGTRRSAARAPEDGGECLLYDPIGYEKLPPEPVRAPSLMALAQEAGEGGEDDA